MNPRFWVGTVPLVRADVGTTRARGWARFRRKGVRDLVAGRPLGRRGRRGRRARVPAVWVFFLADNSATNDWYTFILTTMNGITLAALYFIVASGFTLIFGLMRVVNMAHGTFFLLGGYIALTLQRHWVGQGDFGLRAPTSTASESGSFPRSIGGAARRRSSASPCSSRSCAGTRARSCARR